MTRVSIWCAAVSLILGCHSGEVPERGPDEGADPTVRGREVERPPRPIDVPEPEPAFDSAESVAEEEPQEEASDRNLATELNTAIGVPKDCVRDFEASNPRTLMVTVSATVRPTGVVITPQAYGAGLSDSARRCIERRVEGLALAPLEGDVSERVSTTIQIEYTPGEVTASASSVPEPRLRNTKEPLPKRPEVQPSGRPISGSSKQRWISGGFDGGVQLPAEDPKARKIRGPKPRPIDGYDVDENSQDWR
ncbi:MAG: hypothetical protein AAF500_04010 [Myxococcota bacterium]